MFFGFLVFSFVLRCVVGAIGAVNSFWMLIDVITVLVGARGQFSVCCSGFCVVLSFDVSRFLCPEQFLENVCG